MENDYHDGEVGGLPIMGGTIAKYASILVGVYSVCKDEQDFLVATVAGLGYLLGESFQRSGTSNNAHERFSLLEKTSS